MYLLNTRMKDTLSVFFLATLLASFSFAQIASAHTTGASFTQTSNGYTIDVGYNPISITARDYASFDFLFWKGAATSPTNPTGTPADYAQVWIRIIRDKETLLATGVMHQQYGPTTLLYSFPEAGNYTMEASFRTAEGDEIAIASIPISVAPAAGQTPVGPVLWGLLGLLAGVAAGFVLARRFSK